ncbi:22217_t:CDS:2, partial [Racocetra persica]
VIIGTKSGDLELFDLASSSQTESIKAHDGPIWSLQVRPDKRGLVTGSADSNVKFWDFDMSQEEDTNENQTGSRRLTLIHTRTLKMNDDILCVRYSPNQKLVAVALLDATVK